VPRTDEEITHKLIELSKDEEKWKREIHALRWAIGEISMPPFDDG